MNEKSPPSPHEMLSALVDGEASPFEQRRILLELARDDELRLAWQRMLLVRGVLRGQTQYSSGGVAERVSQALAAEPPRARQRGRLLALSGAAAAAVLALLLFAPWQSLLPAGALPANAAAKHYIQWHSELPALPALGSRRSRLGLPVSLRAMPGRQGWPVTGQAAPIVRPDEPLRPVTWLRQGEVEILRFTNGLSTISVFVEPIAIPEAERVLRQGKVLAYSRMVGEGGALDRLTVVGELSPEDARAVAEQVMRYAAAP